MFGAFGSPAVDVMLAPVLDTVEDEYFAFFFFLVVEEGVSHSPCCFTGILIGCSDDEYRSSGRRQRGRCYHTRLLGRQRF